jgi:hypothetical protein
MPKFRPKLVVAAVVLLMAGVGVYVFWPGKNQPLTALHSVAPVVPDLPALPPAPEALKNLTDIALPWQVRVEALRQALKAQSGEDEFAYLYRLLERGAPPAEQPEHWYVIANDIMEQLSRLDPNEARFSTRLLVYLNDIRQPLVLRDYAVQHLATWINPRAQNFRVVPALPMPAHPGVAATGVPPSELARLRSPAINEAVLNGLVAAAMNPQLEGSTIPGTTCMMLVDLSRTGSGVDCLAALTALKPWLSAALADGSKLSMPQRVSAVQAAALTPQEFRPVLRDLAYQQSGHLALRLPAIATLAQCGDASDLEKLRKISASAPELTFAADDAHRTLTARLGVAASPLPK